jgi:homoserine dehydrogenase
VVTTEPCASATLAEALAGIAKMEFMLEPPLSLEILVVDDPDMD